MTHEEMIEIAAEREAENEVNPVIKQLHNPKSELYSDIKKIITSSDFPWYYEEKSTYKTNFDGPQYCSDPFYSHSFLLRPDNNQLYPVQSCNYLDQIQYFLHTLLHENNINAKCFYRINANCMNPNGSDNLTIPHYDHDFPHKNILVYLTDAGGETVVYKNDNIEDPYEHHPEEDDVIVFEGLHCCKHPKEKRRIVIVATFLCND